ncbi:2'-5' RNA ligase family protein [Haloarchaeobius iranensis]|nr:2'-5' RNA ligase family protein [Haloarchaeobius iranensis]
MSGTYSLWLVPDRDAAAYRQLEETIRELATGQEDAPEFEPHVTVLGGIRGDQDLITERTEELVGNRESLELSFTAVHCSTTKHQCVFLLIQPTRELLSLHQTAAELFDTNPGMYVPHLSLIYSEMSIADRVSMVESIDLEALPATVRTDTLAVVDTTGEVSEWRTISTAGL